MANVLVSPVGLYKNRVLKGIKKLKPDWVFLLVAKGEKDNSWAEYTEKNAREIQEKIGFFYEKQVKVIPCDFENYRNFFYALNHVITDTIPKNVEFPEIWIDLTSVPEIPEIAILALATIHNHVKLFYTKAKTPLMPEEYPGRVITDEGGDMLELPTVRSIQLDDLKNSEDGHVLIAILKAGRCIEGLSTLLDAINWTKEKKDYMRLGRILDRLEKFGMIFIEKINREKKIKLTIWGEMIASCLSPELVENKT